MSNKMGSKSSMAAAASSSTSSSASASASMPVPVHVPPMSSSLTPSIKKLSNASNNTNKKISKEKIEADKKLCEEYNLKTGESIGRHIERRRSIFDLRTSKMRTTTTIGGDGDDNDDDDDRGERRSNLIVPGNHHKKQGRLYCTRQASKPGGLIVDEMIYGIKMAHLSCTDDSNERLIGSSANSIAALEHLVKGLDSNGHPIDNPSTFIKLPLSEILKKKFNLNLDCWIDESGLRKGRAVDTQGYIASNDDTIILSYRFSTSIFDWIANFSMTSSEWEPDVDEELGHAGLCSCTKGWFIKYCTTLESKPRIHTAYYNNFIYTIPMIREHIINKLMKPNGTPKKVYVVGCSLGAAISQIAYCFILEEMTPYLKDPNFINHKLISVTAGCPRVGDMKKMKLLRPLNRAVICRCVYNNDIVPHAPPNVLNFHHLDKMVYITKNGNNVIINPNMSKVFTKFGELQKIYSTLFNKKKDEVTENVKETIHKVQDDIHEVQDHIVDDFNTKRNSNNSRNSISAAGAASDVVAAVAKGNAEEGSAAVIVAAEVEEGGVVAESSTGAAAAAVGVVEKEKTAFEIECENTLEGIHDHMPYWYMTFLEKIRDEQKAIFSSDDDDNDDADAPTPTPAGGDNGNESHIVTFAKDKDNAEEKFSTIQEC